MTKPALKCITALTATACLLLVLWRGSQALAQLPAIGVVEGFEATEYFPGDDFTKLKWRLTGAKAQPQDQKRLLLSGMQFQMFGKAGERSLVVEAPECLYDPNPTNQSASSPGRLKVQVDEGRFEIEGEGFQQQTGPTNSTLVISNQVRATVQRPTTNSAGAVTTSRMLITSRQFEFDSTKREGVFRHDVRAEDPEVDFKCGVMTVTASTNGGTFDTLTAERDVIIVGKTEGLSASAERAFYTRTNETMAFTGNVAWKQGPQEGHAGRAIIHRLDKTFEADNNVAMKLPRGSLGFGGLLPGNTNAVTPATNLTTRVDLFADHVQASSNLTVIHGAVRIRDGTNQLSCDKIVVQNVSTNEQTAVAEGHVAVCRGDEDQCLRADRAVYTKSTGAVVFTGTPTWKLSPTEGRADRVTVHGTNEIHAVGDVAARIALATQSNTFLNLLPNAPETNRAPQVIEVFARELKATDRQVSLLGGARIHQSPITGREPHLECETLDLFFATNSHRVELMQAKDRVHFEQGIPGVTNGPDAYRLLTAANLTAFWDSPAGGPSKLVLEQNVVIDATDTKGQPSHATADKLVYSSQIQDGVTNKTIELTGNPQLTNSTGRLTGGVIVWDLVRERFYTRNYNIDFNATTNKLSPDLAPPFKPKK